MPDKDGNPTESEVNDALSVLRRDYYADVRGAADAWKEAKEYARKNGESFDATDALHEIIDSHQRVIYTFQARIGLLCSDNEDAYQEEIGEPAPTVEAACFMAMQRDVTDYLGDDFNDDMDQNADADADGSES